MRRTPQARPAGVYAVPGRGGQQLWRLANDLGTSQQALIAEGINHVLAKYNKPT